MAESIKLEPKAGPLRGSVSLPISKSICNRLLILSKLAGQEFPKDQLSEADDSQLLFRALHSSETTINVENAGTAFRFLTAYFSIQDGRETTLTGSEAMLSRPIGPLVEALKSIGAEIEYVGKEGFPPVKIKGKKLRRGRVKIGSEVSSQFISALMLIGSELENGLTIELEGDSVSSSYLDMTLSVIQSCGGMVSTSDHTIQIKSASLNVDVSHVERDWSSASYFFGMAALRPNSEILLESLTLDSVQGDVRIAKIMERLGVESEQNKEGVLIRSRQAKRPTKFEYDLSSEPDLVQTLACVHAGRGDEVFYSGIDHLKYKETDRLSALQTEFEKFNLRFVATENVWVQSGKPVWNGEPIATYGDHRMAMAFSILATQFDGLEIENRDVVAKSFPGYWEEVVKLTS